MSLFKYFGDRGGKDTTHEGSLQWAQNGEYMPFRNLDQIALTEAEVEAVEEFADFHCKQFDLWDAEQLKAYTEIQDRITNRWYTLKFIDRQYMSEHNGWRVLLEWTQNYAHVPDSKVPRDLRAPRQPPSLDLLQASQQPFAAR